MLQTYVYQRLIKPAKFVVLLLTSLFIFYKLIFAYKINVLFHDFNANDHTRAAYLLVLAIVLVLFNWGLESYKWNMLIGKFETMRFGNAFKAVLSGVCLSIITPNQVGDFAGRVIHLRILDKIKGSLVTVIGHTAQVLITCFFGLFALWYLTLPGNNMSVMDLSDAYSSREAAYAIIAVSFVVLALVAIAAYLNLQRIYEWLRHFRWVQKAEKYVNVFGAYTPRELLAVLLISLLRYCVFLGQYYLLLLFFDVPIAPLPALACIVATFCVQSVVPSFFLLEIGLRGASALWFFGLFSNHHTGVLMAAYSLWMINMMLPALLGMWFIYKVKA